MKERGYGSGVGLIFSMASVPVSKPNMRSFSLTLRLVFPDLTRAPSAAILVASTPTGDAARDPGVREDEDRC